MAISLIEKYPGRTGPANADYPYGSVKNESAPEANDGTPLEQDWGNDIEGFKQALLAAAKINPNGTPDSAVASQQLQALRALAAADAKAVMASATLAPAEAGVVLVDASAGDVTVTLPAANAVAGLRYTVVRVDESTHAVTLACTAGDSIDGESSIRITPDARWTVAADGVSRWVVTGNHLVADSSAPVPVRQTVLSGPVNADGHAAFITTGASLQATTTGLNTTPLIVTWGDGFGVRGERNWIAELKDDLLWPGLPDNTVAYLYLDLERDSGAVSTGHTTLAPVYAHARPIAPAAGQCWYPVDHRSRAEVWNGSAWVPTLRLFVGQVTTSGGAVVEAVSYAYQGRYSAEPFAIATASSYVIRHNIGAPCVSESVALNASGEENALLFVYPEGQTSGGRGVFSRLDRLALRFRTGRSTTTPTLGEDTGETGGTWISLRPRARRAF